MARKILFTHPDNAEFLQKELDKFYQSPDIHMPFKFEIRTDAKMEQYLEDRSRIIWHDTKFVKYSDGPSKGSKMTYWQYVQMCIYWGWAEFYKERLFYEFNGEFLKPPLDILDDRRSDFTRSFMMGEYTNEVITNRNKPVFYI